jgi:hypothetical protein
LASWSLAVTLAVTVATLLVVSYGVTTWRAGLLAEGRRRAVAEAEAVARSVTQPMVVQMAALQDSLRRVVAARDTVLVERLRVVRERLTDTLRLTDTVQVAAALTACRAAAADCEAFRWSATRALLVADSVRHLDSLAQRALALRLGALRDSLARVTRERDRRPTWRTAWTQATVGAAVGLAAGSLLTRE